MSRNYAKTCRICLAEGKFCFVDLFSNAPGAGRCESVSSVSRLLEKFRFVTMIQISESDNLPTMICDSCIVELNVAYNFKRQAIDSSVFLQRHFIEMGRCEEGMDARADRPFHQSVQLPGKDSLSLEVKEELLEPAPEDIPTSTNATLANSVSPSTSIASGSSRSMVLVNTKTFPNIGADSTSDKDFVDSYLPPKKRGREFQVQRLTPTTTNDVDVQPSKVEEIPEEKVSVTEEVKKIRRGRKQPLEKAQISLRPRQSMNYAEKLYKSSKNIAVAQAQNKRRTLPEDNSGKSTRNHRRYKNTSMTTPAGQSINPVAVAKTMMKTRAKRLTIS
ncbi:hypothetical protein DMENIID0001_065870 [Sergentomyia squamirostris]